MMVRVLVGVLMVGGLPASAGEILRGEVSGVTRATSVEVGGLGTLEVRGLGDAGGPSLTVTPGQWYRYHSITTSIWFYTSLPLWIAQRVDVTLNAGESTPVYVDSMEIFVVANNQDPGFTDTAYIWADNAGRPGAVLHRIPFRVPTAAGRAGWRILLSFSDPLVVNTPTFWVGLRSLAQAAPADTVFVASEPCTACANPATVNLYSTDGTTWASIDRDWGVAVYARKAHQVDEGVWSLVFPNWPFVVDQLDGDTVAVVHRNWGGSSLNTMGGRLVVTFRGTSDTFLTPLTAGPYPSTAQDTFWLSMAPYVGQGVSDVIEFVAWSEQVGDQDPTNDTLRFTDYVFPNYTQWAQGWEFSTTGWAAYDRDGNGSSWAVYVGGGMHTGYRGVGDTARAGEDNVLVGPAWTLGGVSGDATYGNVLVGFVNVPVGASVTLRVMVLDGPDPATAGVLYQRDHGLTGLAKAGWVQVQDTLPASLNGATVYPAWQVLSVDTVGTLVLLDNLHGRSAPLALEVGEGVRDDGRVRVVWRMPGVVEVGARVPVVLEVYGVAGRRVKVWRLLPGVHRVGLGDLAPGVYTLRVREDGRQRSQSLRIVIP